MNITRAYKLPIHNHPLFPSSMFCYVECDGCHKIWHMSDEHPLTLSCDQNGSGGIWLVLHVQCVLGDFSRLKPGWLYTLFERREYEVVLNNRNTRPFCSHCHSRCKVPVILKDSGKDNGYICSNSCLFSCLGIKFL
ncbi:BnaCnng76070D [Brassica napus]|uniref:BnaCnng76070D protein n=1 Tax=Brassica napus TaxID=3708 RepID=A0A078JWU5_BRANA|nr:BnaCnng76070D [Brassica napus]